MRKLKIGVLGPSEIAFRRFLPALKLSNNFEYVGIAIANLDERKILNGEEGLENILGKSQEKANKIMNNFGGQIFYSYEDLLVSKNIEAVYIPLPPALHYFWAKKALENGKHVLLEKPFTTNLSDTKALINLAKDKGLAVHENFAFCYHEQINTILHLIEQGEIGEIRQIRSAFGFPYKGEKDFRYNKSLGGGALLDCGVYPIKLSTLLLGETAEIQYSKLNRAKNHEVDIYGSVILENDNGISSQISFGMDNSYKCELEIWGSEGYIYAPRIFTAPADLKPKIIFKREEEQIIEVPSEDQFLGSINRFYDGILNDEIRIKMYNEIERQARCVEDVLKNNSDLKGDK